MARRCRTTVKFNSNKAEQQQERDIAAREAALKHLCIKQQFGYADQAIIYEIVECLEGEKGYKPIHKRATSESTNSTVINLNKAEQQQERDIAASEAALKHLDIKLQFGYADHATIYDFAERAEDTQTPIHIINASIAPAPITEYSEN